MAGERGQPLDGDTIRRLLVEVAELLDVDGGQHVVLMAGGSLMAWRGLRATTADVDSVRRLDAGLRFVVATVAARHDLAPGWLNDRAVAFLPATFEMSEGELLLDLPQLRVVGVRLADLFVMKLYAARDRDIDDLVTLWPHTGFRDAHAAAAAFRLAYPHAPDDPYLENWIATLIPDR